MTVPENLQTIVDKAQNGDEKAFGELYDIFSNRLFAFIMVKTSHRPTAEDLLQEVFIKIWKALPKYEKQDVQFSSWLYAIASNHIKDHYRAVSRRPQTNELLENIDKVTDEDLSKPIDNEFLKNDLEKVLEQLPENYREVVQCRFLSDLTVSETAQVVGKTELAVRVIQTRALSKLRKIFKSADKPNV